ncbi:MAG TPA: glycosyltransferase family 2 protein [Gemmatimonadaceae bacterium]|nr:glycosyltransferase family 2 protein [Gemmatimonadaceae bacterium]
MANPAFHLSDFDAPDLSSAPLATPRVALTVVVPTLNAAPRLAAALQSVSFADEIIVVDAGSSDDTLGVARAHGAQVMSIGRTTIGMQRNAGIAAARNAWILALDSDEVVTEELRASLARVCADQSPIGRAYKVRSRNWHLGRELRHGPWGRDWKVRVFSRDARFNAARVHERIQSSAPVAALDGALLHWPYDDLAHQIVKIAQYAKWSAEDMRAHGRHAHVRDIIARPIWRFVRDYVLFSGWRDGVAGFVVSVASAFSVFLKYASLWFSSEAV